MSDGSCATPDKSRPRRGSPALRAAYLVLARYLLASSLLLMVGCATSETSPVAADEVIGDYDNACLP